MTRALVVAACAALALAAGSGCDREAAAPARDPGLDARARETTSGEVPPTLVRPPAETGGAATRAATRPATRPSSPDVPEGSRDPVVDGMKSLIREMILRGFANDQRAALADRIVLILEIAGLGEEARRRVEAEVVAKTLLDVQEEFRPKDPGAVKKFLNSDDEQRVRIAAEALAKDMYRKLQAIAAPGSHLAGQHAAALRAAPTLTVPAGYEGVTWKTLGGFEYTEGMELPAEVRKLNGAKVGMAGYMMTIEEVENIREFLLVEAFWSCCFGTPPNVNQVLMVRVLGEKGVEYTSSPVMILGTLEVGEEIEDGFVTSVYRLKATSVTAAE